MMTCATEVRERAARALQQSPLPALRRLSVEQTEDIFVLTGRVQTYYAKQMAQETVLPYLAGRELINRVLVERTERKPAETVSG